MLSSHYCMPKEHQSFTSRGGLRLQPFLRADQAPLKTIHDLTLLAFYMGPQTALL